MGLDYAAPPCRIMADSVAAEGIRSRLNAAFPRPRRVVGIHISARKPSQRWPAQAFAALARQLAADGSVCLLLWAPGSSEDPQHPGDDEKAAQIMALSAGVALFPFPTGRLEELIAALSLCEVVVCSDGGAMHLAAGLGKPIVCLFGQSTVSRWHPWGVPYSALQHPNENVADINVAEVMAAYARIQVTQEQGA
jgi:ADP-heptose:LPS heptosyltransferase